MGYKGKSTGQGKYDRNKPIKIDLHRKTVVEAKSIVIEVLGSAHTGDVLHIITGKGLSRGKSVLSPEIKQFVTQLGYDWRPARLADGGDGVIVIQR